MTETIIELPKEKVVATKVVPESLALFGLPKCGKTTALSELENNLIIDVENGANFVDAMRMAPPKDSGPVATFNWLKAVAAKIKADGRPYDFVTIDTISELDAMAEWVGTFNYMNHSQGKKFNRDAAGAKLKPSDPSYESVHDLPEGYGYRWSRNAILDLIDELKGLGKICTIFVCHVADKYLGSKQTNTEVRSLDLSLTGKVKTIFSRDVDAIGYVYNKDGKLQISFKGNEEKLGGMRGAKHIQGYEGPLDWNKLFLLDKVN